MICTLYVVGFLLVLFVYGYDTNLRKGTSEACIYVMYAPCRSVTAACTYLG